MQRSSVGLVIVTVLSCAFLAFGAVMMLTPPPDTASFGWFAYQPLSSSVIMSGSPAGLSPTVLAGIAFAAVGLLGIGGVAGFLIGRRVRRG